MFQWLRFTQSSERITLDIADQGINSLQDLVVGLLPVQIIIPSPLAKLNDYRLKAGRLFSA